MRTPLIAGNWKMNKTHLEAIHFVEQLGHELANHDARRVEVVLCPPATALRSVQTTIDDRHQTFGLGAQNMHFEDSGAFTGEVSPLMLKALHVKYVILGHSERREMFGDTNESVNQKVRAAFAHGLIPIMCCGETDMERTNARTEAKVEAQVREGLSGLAEAQAREVVVAYEPIWAIGTGKTATPEDAQTTISFIRGVLTDLFSDDVATGIRILYGGSMKAGNAAALVRQADIDGGLVGGASLDAGEFAAMVKAVAGGS
ncbi:MAG: triose-phosphate isomerase [Actinomycetota bacterium]|nr:triose-phosphate isomerase [Actinomycetota bacterium]